MIWIKHINPVANEHHQYPGPSPVITAFLWLTQLAQLTWTTKYVLGSENSTHKDYAVIKIDLAYYKVNEIEDDTKSWLKVRGRGSPLFHVFLIEELQKLSDITWSKIRNLSRKSGQTCVQSFTLPKIKGNFCLFIIRYFHILFLIESLDLFKYSE